jgi:hypothetical protein
LIAEKPVAKQIVAIAFIFLTFQPAKALILTLKSHNVKKCKNHLLLLEY